MPRSLCRRLALIAVVGLVVTATACGDDSTSSPLTTTSPTTNISLTFTGQLATNGAASFPFSSTGGVIGATLTSLAPGLMLDTVTPLKVGLWIGVWDGARCTFGVALDNAAQGSTVNVIAISAGTYCVRIYDSKGDVPQTQTFRIDVAHP